MASNDNGERFAAAAAASNTVTSRRGKNKSNNNNNNSEKPKQPQRGLGVAQLEKIRLHSQLINRGFLNPNHHHLHPHHHHPRFIHPPYQHVPEYQFGYQIPPPPPPPPPPPQPQQQPAPPFGYSVPQVASSSYGYHHHLNASMMEMRNQMERYGESQPINTARWNPSNNLHGAPETQPNPFPPGMITRHLLSHVEQENCCSSQNFDSNGKEEVDLELKL